VFYYATGDIYNSFGRSDGTFVELLRRSGPPRLFGPVPKG
jgi:hypothetical protein